ncbi:MAG: HlyD family efflux transporter periplasmic adaptor subunit [Nannocystales bacterium]
MEFREACVSRVRNDGVARHRSLAAPRLLRLPVLFSVALVAALLLSALLTSNNVAQGRVVIRIPGTQFARAPAPSVVADVAVEAGQHVQAGVPLMRLHDEALGRELEMARRARDEAMFAMLRTPRDVEVKRRLRDLDQALSLTEARMDQLTITSPDTGTVTAIRVEEGSVVGKGDILASIQRPGSAPEAIAYFPGHLAPRIETGDALRVEFDDGKREAFWFTVTEVDHEALAPASPTRRSALSQPNGGNTDTQPRTVVAIRAKFAPDRRAPASGSPTSAVPAGHGGGDVLVDGLAGRAELVVRRRSLFLRVLEGLGLLRADA